MARSQEKRKAGSPAADKARIPQVARLMLAFLAPALTSMSSAGGLFTVAPNWQTGVIGGLVAGLVAPNRMMAALAGGFGAGVSVFWLTSAQGPSVSATGKAAEVATALLCGAAVGYVARLLMEKRGRWPLVLTACAIAMLVVNMWVTTIVLDAKPLQLADGESASPVWVEVSGENGHFAAFDANSDTSWYYRVYWQVRHGKPYYPAFQSALLRNPDWEPAGVTHFKMPTIFWFWALFANGQAVVFAFLVLATAAVLAVLPICGTFTKLPLVIPACAALASYFTFFSTTPLVFSIEVWGSFFALASLAAFALSTRGRHWRVHTIASVLLAVIAVLVRETLVFCLIGGVLSALVERDQRRFRLAAWLGGVAITACAYLAHARAAAPFIVPGPTQFTAGGLSNAVSALTYATDLLGGPRIFLLILATLGLAGALAIPKRGLRTYALSLTYLPIATFLFVANRTTSQIGHHSVNVWGPGVLPIVYALIPLGLTLLTTL